MAASRAIERRILKLHAQGFDSGQIAVKLRVAWRVVDRALRRAEPSPRACRAKRLPLEGHRNLAETQAACPFPFTKHRTLAEADAQDGRKETSPAAKVSFPRSPLRRRRRRRPALKGVDAAVLRALIRVPGADPKRLAELAGTTLGPAVRALRRLHARGYLIREGGQSIAVHLPDGRPLPPPPDETQAEAMAEAHVRANGVTRCPPADAFGARTAEPVPVQSATFLRNAGES